MTGMTRVVLTHFRGKATVEEGAKRVTPVFLQALLQMDLFNDGLSCYLFASSSLWAA